VKWRTPLVQVRCGRSGGRLERRTSSESSTLPGPPSRHAKEAAWLLVSCEASASSDRVFDLTRLLVVAAAAIGTASAAAAPAAKQCAPIKAGGETYTVSVISASCSFADKWAAKLAGKRLAAHVASTPLPGGPAGWSCRAGTRARTQPLLAHLPANVQIAGNCGKGNAILGGLGGSPYFNWSIKTPPS